MSKILINIKPSHIVVTAFKKKFPTASFYGATSLGKKGKSYLIALDEYNANIKDIKLFGSKSTHQQYQ